MTDELKGLALLRAPFPQNQISYLPKGGTHLAYVGHAALTDRLLDADPNWSWEPLAMNDGLPVFDGFGGMWIRLTVCGVTRLGYGHAGNKEGGDAIKEVIGDALRNAAMRFGAALDLWHKGDLHVDDKAEEIAREVERAKWIAERIVEIEQAKTVGQLKKVFDAAVAVTRQQADPDAERQLQAAADAKAALAKAKAPTTATQE